MTTLQALMLTVNIGGVAFALILSVTTHKKLAIKVSGHFLLAVGSLAMLGYVLGVPQLYTLPPGGTSIALPTAVCIIVIGANLLILANGKLS